MAFLGTYPGEVITEAWWEEMLVQWFDVPEEEKPAERLHLLGFLQRNLSV